MDRADFVAEFPKLFGGFTDRAVGGAPADEENVALFVAVELGCGERVGELDELFATLCSHRFVVLRAIGRVAPFVVFESGDNGIFAF